MYDSLLFRIPFRPNGNGPSVCGNRSWKRGHALQVWMAQGSIYQNQRFSYGHCKAEKRSFHLSSKERSLTLNNKRCFRLIRGFRSQSLTRQMLTERSLIIVVR